MRFWDASAIVPVCCVEETTARMRAMLRSDRGMVVWWATSVECTAAIERLVRTTHLDDYQRSRATSILEKMEARWVEVSPSENLRLQSIRLLRLHALRTGDALQLAAALTWARMRPQRREFVCLDDRLRAAAAAEGFTVFPS